MLTQLLLPILIFLMGCFVEVDVWPVESGHRWESKQSAWKQLRLNFEAVLLRVVGGIFVLCIFVGDGREYGESSAPLPLCFPVARWSSVPLPGGQRKTMCCVGNWWMLVHV